MMREIKFKGLTDNGWVYGHLTGLEDSVYIQVAKTRDDGGNVGHIENYLEQVEVDPGTIGQFIGITDKNNTEVFEGDLVTVGCSDPSEVYWDEEACQFRTDDAFEHMPLGLLEVVGNIYENPELIKEGKE